MARGAANVSTVYDTGFGRFGFGWENETTSAEVGRWVVQLPTVTTRSGNSGQPRKNLSEVNAMASVKVGPDPEGTPGHSVVGRPAPFSACPGSRCRRRSRLGLRLRWRLEG
jgi:hypothetical protein